MFRRILICASTFAVLSSAAIAATPSPYSLACTGGGAIKFVKSGTSGTRVVQSFRRVERRSVGCRGDQAGRDQTGCCAKAWRNLHHRGNGQTALYSCTARGPLNARLAGYAPASCRPDLCVWQRSNLPEHAGRVEEVKNEARLNSAIGGRTRWILTTSRREPPPVVRFSTIRCITRLLAKSETWKSCNRNECVPRRSSVEAEAQAFSVENRQVRRTADSPHNSWPARTASWIDGKKSFSLKSRWLPLQMSTQNESRACVVRGINAIPERPAAAGP